MKAGSTIICRRLVLSLALVPLGGGGCGEKIDPIQEQACSPTEIVTWEGQAGAIFAQYCTSCHSSQNGGTARRGAPATVNFDTYALAFANADRADERGGIGTSMPPSPPRPSPDERSIIHCWVADGKRER